MCIFVRKKIKQGNTTRFRCISSMQQLDQYKFAHVVAGSTILQLLLAILIESAFTRHVYDIIFFITHIGTVLCHAETRLGAFTN